MTKNGIIGLSLSTIAVLTGLTFYTDSAFNQQIEDMISQEQQGSVQVALESKTQGTLSGDAQYKVLIPEEAIRQIHPDLSINEPLELYINHHHNSYPLYVTSEITLDLTKGTVEPILHAYPDLNLEHLLTVNTNLLFQSNTTNLVIKPIEFKDEYSTVSVGNIDLTTDTNFAYDSGDFSGSIDKFNMDLYNMGKFSFSGLTSNFDINIIDGMLLTPKSTFSLDQVSFVSKSRQVDMDLNMKDLSVISGYQNLDSDMFDGTSTLKIAALDLNTNGEKYNVTDTILALTVKGIDKAGLLAIDKASKTNDTDALLDGIALLFKRNIHGEISHLNTNINDVAIKTNGDYSLAPYEGSNLSTELPLYVMTNLTINYDINLSNNYAEVFPQFAPMIEVMVAQDFMTADDNGNISTKLNMINGEVTANGNRIR